MLRDQGEKTTPIAFPLERIGSMGTPRRSADLTPISIPLNAMLATLAAEKRPAGDRWIPTRVAERYPPGGRFFDIAGHANRRHQAFVAVGIEGDELLASDLD